jgi:hypothetical protein
MTGITRAELAKLPQASGLQVLRCDDPDCGPHIVLFGEDHKPIAEVVVFRSDIPDLVEQLCKFVSRQ